MSKLEEQLAALVTMSPAQLRAEWARVRREPAPALSPDLLMRGIAYRLQERQYGGLLAAARKELTGLARQFDRTGTIAADRGSTPKARHTACSGLAGSILHCADTRRRVPL